MSSIARILVGIMAFFFTITILLIVINGWVIPAVNLSNARQIATTYAEEYSKTGNMDVVSLEEKLKDVGLSNINIVRPATVPDWGERYTITITGDYDISVNLLFMTNIEIRNWTNSVVLYSDEIVSGSVRGF